MISERKLKEWRREAIKATSGDYPDDTSIIIFDDQCKQIIQMTQELLDQHLMKGIEKNAITKV